MPKKKVYLSISVIFLICCSIFAGYNIYKNLNQRNQLIEQKKILLATNLTKTEQKNLSKTLKQIAGITEFKILNKKNILAIKFDSNKISYEEIIYQIEDSGLKIKKTAKTQEPTKLKVIDFQVNYN